MSWMGIGVILTYDKKPIIVKDIDTSFPTHNVLGELFVMQDNVFSRPIGDNMHSFPMYDWLRNNEKGIVGVRFIHIDAGGYDHILGRRNVIDHRAERWDSSFTIFFGAEREFEPKEHLYLGFGGNELYVGSNGSTMITFYPPSNERFLGD